MVTVTERAEEELRRILVTSGASPNEGLRFYPRINSSYLLSIGAELSGDQLVEHRGLKVLLIGPSMIGLTEPEDSATDMSVSYHFPLLLVILNTILRKMEDQINTEPNA